MNRCKLYADGASKGNPGPAGIGFVIKNTQGDTLSECSRKIGNFTNNIAEYFALIAGLLESRMLGIDSLDVYLDSELLVKQIQGLYQVKAPHLQPLAELVRYLNKKFSYIRYNYIERNKNFEADKLASAALGSQR